MFAVFLPLLRKSHYHQQASSSTKEVHYELYIAIGPSYHCWDMKPDPANSLYHI